MEGTAKLLGRQCPTPQARALSGWTKRSGRLTPARHRCSKHDSHRCKAQESGPQTAAPVSSSVVGDACELTAQDQEQIAEVAAVVIMQAKTVLSGKLADYQEQLREVEEDSARNFIYRALNRWTQNLLTKKIAFVEERLRVMERLQADVLSCSLDGTCVFQLKTSADLRQIMRSVGNLADDLASMPGDTSMPGDPSVTDDVKLLTKLLPAGSASAVVEKDMDITTEPLSWTMPHEACDLEDALWDASVKASAIPGACVLVDKQYSMVKLSVRRGTGFEKFMENVTRDNLPAWMQDVPEAEENVPFEVALGSVVLLALTGAFASLVAWPLGAQPYFDNVLHWEYLLPTNLEAVSTLFFWTAPLAAVYSALALLRTYNSRPSLHPSPLDSALQVASIAATHLQTGNRQLQYALSCKRDDMKILYFLATVYAVCSTSVYAYALLPGVAINLAPLAMANGSPELATIQMILLTPAIAILVGILVAGSGVSYAKIGDKLGVDAVQDTTKFVDGLLHVSDTLPVTFITDAKTSKLSFVSNLGGASQEAKQILRTGLKGLVNVDQKTLADFDSQLDSLSRAPPSAVTMDFQSANKETAVAQRAEWIQPTAVFLVAAYLCLETLVTKQVTNAMFSEIVAICCLDYLSTPWNCCNMTVRVELPPRDKVTAK